MSGGVDSSVAAMLLKKQGYDVVGVTMQIWQDEETAVQEENGGCCGLSAVDDACRVASQLDIPYYVMNFKKEFKEWVMVTSPGNIFGEGRRIHVSAQSVCKMGSSFTSGHVHRRRLYCHRTLRQGGPTGKRQIYSEKAPSRKDQTYALYNLTQEQLSKTLMPDGDYTKEEIRQMAEEMGLLVASKPDSQDICFIPDGNYQKFLYEYTGRNCRRGILSIRRERFSAPMRELPIIR